MSDVKDIERLQSYLDELADKNHGAKEKVDNLAFGLFFLAAITAFTFGYVCYYAEKTNERLLRLEKIIGMDEIGRRK
jgi:hypothetical protein